MASIRKKTATPGRIDWSAIRDQTDLAAVATSLLGPAPGRRGEKGRRLWWSCPLGTHPDSNPSFAVTPGKGTWKCHGCGEHGDAANLVMRLRGVTFPLAIAYLTGRPGKRPPAASKPAEASVCPAERSSGLSLARYLNLVNDAANRIWTPEGRDALAYLRGRGLTDLTIRAGRLGWTPEVMLPSADGIRYWPATGVVIPWFDGDRLAVVKIRQPVGRKPKYAEAFRDGPAMFPAPSVVRPGKPLVIVEGEFDALLLGQELADLAAVLTLGSASARPEGSTYLAMLAAPIWYLAHDADDAGDKAASGWPSRAIRVRPPAPTKDWTEAFQYPINLRRWWTDRLGGIEAPALSSWDELASRRWGPAIGDPEPGIIVDGFARGTIVIVDDPEERAAIQGGEDSCFKGVELSK